MSWLNPLPKSPVTHTMIEKRVYKTPDTSKAVVVNGVRYRSKLEACAALRCSNTKLERILRDQRDNG